MNLFEKLVEARKKIGHIKKDQKAYKYKSVSSASVFDTIRPVLDEVGVFVFQAVDSVTYSDHVTKNDGKQTIASLKLIFTFVNVEKPEEKMVIPWASQAVGDVAQSVGSALTYGLKYFLLDQFLVSCDEKDDPDFEVKPKPEKKTSPNKILWGTAIGRFGPYVEGDTEANSVAKFFLERSAEKINSAKNPIDQPEKLSSVSALSDIEKMNLVSILKELKPVQLQGAVYDYRISLNDGKAVEHDFQEGIPEPVGRRQKESR